MAIIANISFGMVPPYQLYNVKAESEDVTETVSSFSEYTEEEDLQQQEADTAAEEKEASILAEESKKAEEERKKEKAKKAEEEAKKKEAAKVKEAAKKKAEADKNAYNIKMTAKDKENLYRLVQSEVGYMDEKSKLYVASVVLNRVKHSSFPNTVTGVVMAHNPKNGVYQFSPVKPGGRFWYCEVTKETKKAVDKVLKNGDQTNGAIAFVAKRYTTAKAASWFDNTLHHLFNHNGQDYYKYKKY